MCHSFRLLDNQIQKLCSTACGYRVKGTTGWWWYQSLGMLSQSRRIKLLQKYVLWILSIIYKFLVCHFFLLVFCVIYGKTNIEFVFHSKQAAKQHNKTRHSFSVSETWSHYTHTINNIRFFSHCDVFITWILLNLQLNNSLTVQGDQKCFENFSYLKAVF